MCEMRVAPTIGAVTSGLCNSHASAIWAGAGVSVHGEVVVADELFDDQAPTSTKTFTALPDGSIRTSNPSGTVSSIATLEVMTRSTGNAPD